MVKTYFSDPQLYLLITGICCFLLSLFFHVKGKEQMTIMLLILAALAINFFAAILDPFLNIWDERFHALVAKNLLEHPFKLTLYDDPVVNMAYDRWDRYHIWLHKQPLFLWQIALSFKLFGISELSLRLPNVLMGTILSFVIYDAGKTLAGKNVGYLASVLFISSSFMLDLVAGRQAVDHNDFSFLFYVSLSIWGLVKYNQTKNRKWVYIIGLFSGAAILCKWVVGLLVYFGWFLLEVPTHKWRFWKYKELMTSAAIAVFIALPWQIFSFLKYPAEAKAAYMYNLHHFSKPLDGHSGTIFYHLDNFDWVYGLLASFFIIPGLMALWKVIKDKKMYLPIVGMVFIVFLFFSLASTKMPAFTTVVVMLVFISMAAFFELLFLWIGQLKVLGVLKGVMVSLVIVLIVGLRFDVEYFQAKYTLWKEDNYYTRELSYNKMVFEALDLPENVVLFNVRDRHYIEAMFYTGLPAYSFVPSKEQFDAIIAKGRIAAIFPLLDGDYPDYIKDEGSTIYIKESLR